MDESNSEDPPGNYNAVVFTFGCASLLVPGLSLLFLPVTALVFLFSKNLEHKSVALWLMLGSATAIGLVGLMMRSGIGDFGQ